MMEILEPNDMFLKAVKEHAVEFVNLETNESIEKETDVVVLSLGVKPNNALVETLTGEFPKLLLVGDCNSGAIHHATTQGFMKAFAL